MHDALGVGRGLLKEASQTGFLVLALNSKKIDDSFFSRYKYGRISHPITIRAVCALKEAISCAKY